MKKVCLIAAIALVGLLVVGLTSTSFAQEEPSEERVLIGFKDEAGWEAAQRHRIWVDEIGGEVSRAYRILPAVAAKLSKTQISRLRADPRVAFVEKDVEVHALQEELPWGIARIDTELVHPYNKGTGVKVAIIDTGIDVEHEDLSVIDGHRYLNQGEFDDVMYDDDNGHGTHCAGIVAALDNDIGVIGVAPEASLYAVKVLDRGEADG